MVESYLNSGRPCVRCICAEQVYPILHGSSHRISHVRNRGLALRVERVTMAQYQSSPVRKSGSELY
jgi:hypothetical protein